jgi:hypothetical protein
MITLYFGTTDTDLTTGRTKTHAAIHAQMTAIGLGDLFPAAQTTKKGAASDAYDPLLQTHLAFEIPGSRLAALAAVPAPYKAALSASKVLVDTHDGLLMQPGTTPSDLAVATGYFLNMYVSIPGNNALDAALQGLVSSRWTTRPNSTRTASAREQQLDPGRPGTVLWKQDATGVMFQPTPPRFPKAGIVT